MNPTTQDSDAWLTGTFELMARMATAFVTTLGSSAEIVVHDLRHPDASVVAIAGSLTDRRVGSPIPDPEFLPDRLSEIGSDQLCYPTQTPDGRILNSSTVFIRDHAGQIAGAVCLNVDRSDLVAARDLLDRLLAPAPDLGLAAQPLATFATSTDQVVKMAVDATVARLGRPRHRFTRADRIEAIRDLDRTGVFRLRNAPMVVATELGVSRASVFNYLRTAREDSPPSPEPSREPTWLT